MIRIPLSFIWEMDDVGWDNGDDLSVYGKASRSGIPRDHVLTAKIIVINDDIYATMLFADEY